MYGTNYSFQEEDAADGISFEPSDQGRSTRQFVSSKHHKYNKRGYENAPTQSKEEDPTTRLSPSSLRPVSFTNETINDHPPLMLAKTSTR